MAWVGYISIHRAPTNKSSVQKEKHNTNQPLLQRSRAVWSRRDAATNQKQHLSSRCYGSNAKTVKSLATISWSILHLQNHCRIVTIMCSFVSFHINLSTMTKWPQLTCCPEALPVGKYNSPSTQLWENSLYDNDHSAFHLLFCPPSV